MASWGVLAEGMDLALGPFLPEPGDNDDGRRAAQRCVQQRRESFTASGYIGDPGHIINLTKNHKSPCGPWY